MKNRMNKLILNTTIIIYICIVNVPLLAANKGNFITNSDSAIFSIPINTYKIKTIKKEKKFYIIYAYRNDKIYKIVSIKDTISCPKNQKIYEGKEYKLILESYFARYDKNGMKLPFPGETGAGGLSFFGKTVDIEEADNYIWDLFRATNLRGLCIVKEE